MFLYVQKQTKTARYLLKNTLHYIFGRKKYEEGNAEMRKNFKKTRGKSKEKIQGIKENVLYAKGTEIQATEIDTGLYFGPEIIYASFSPGRGGIFQDKNL